MTSQHRRTHRHRVRLTPLPPVPVAFTGARAADGPLTLGQLNILQGLSVVPDHFFATICGELEVPNGVSVGDVGESLAVLLGRHEGLRTTYAGGERSHQRVLAGGTVTLNVFELGDGHWEDQDRPAVAQSLILWLRTQGSLDLNQLPIRVVVAVDGSTPARRVVACAAQFSHLAVDYQAMEIVRREFAELVGDRSARHVGGPRHQPLDQVDLEAAPAAQRRAEAALCYWQDQLERMPPCLYAKPAGGTAGESLVIELTSRAVALAVRGIAARTRASRSSIVLAAICAVLSERTGYRELVFPIVSSNRFDRHLVQYVGTVAQGSIVTVHAGSGGFDALVKQTWTAVIEACRYARYDVFNRVELGQRIEHERGVTFKYEPLFNSVVAESRSAVDAGPASHPDEVTAALSRTELNWWPMPAAEIPLRFDLYQLDDVVRLDLWNSGTQQVPREEMKSLLLAVERLLVTAAHTDLEPTRIPDVLAIDPISRGPGWVFVDGCWVEIAAVQRLLDEALAPSTTQIFAAVDGHSLVAYLTATPSIHTPEQAHAHCLSALPNHPTAITPRHYVICRTAPSILTNPTHWDTIHATGSGPGRPQGRAAPQPPRATGQDGGPAICQVPTSQSGNITFCDGRDNRTL